MTRSPALAWAALAAGLVACPAPEPTAPAPAARSPVAGRFLLLATADVGSDTDVCGCKIKRLGGLSRRSHVVKARRAAFDGPSLVVDAGDLFFRRWSVPPRYQPQALRTAQLHADALADWGASAVAVGERDLAFGVGTLRRLARRAGVELLSANLVTDSGTTAFAPYAVVAAGALRIGFVGASPMLMADDPAVQVYERAGLRSVQEGPAVLEAARAARRAGAHWVVGLLHVGQDRALALLDSLPQDTLDFAVVGHDRVVDGLRLLGGGQRGYVQGGERGKWVVAVETAFDDRARRIIDGGAADAQRRVRAQLRAQIEATRDPMKRARLERRLKRHEDEDRPPSFDYAHRVRVALIELTEQVPRDPEMLRRYRRYQAELGDLADINVRRAELTYVGHRECGRCHEAALAHWKKTGHARAWQTMVRTRQTSNLDCIGCHLTGFERPGGPRRLADLDAFRNVGCESCHGPGSAHAEDPSRGLDYGREVPERVCAECHRVQADQKPFEYARRLRQVVGPGHGERRE